MSVGNTPASQMMAEINICMTGHRNVGKKLGAVSVASAKIELMTIKFLYGRVGSKMSVE